MVTSRCFPGDFLEHSGKSLGILETYRLSNLVGQEIGLFQQLDRPLNTDARQIEGKALSGFLPEFGTEMVLADLHCLGYCGKIDRCIGVLFLDETSCP